MPRTAFLLTLLLALVLAVPVLAQESTPTALPSPAPFPAVAILSPLPGEVLSGVVTISGNSAVPAFAQADIAFAYAGVQAPGWFLIQSSLVPVVGAPLALWDTTRVSDGAYDLRLRVTLTDGSVQEVVLAGVRVLNYTPTETATPTAAPTATETPFIPATLVPTLTPTWTVTPFPTPTPLDPNPAVLARATAARFALIGALAAAGFFLLFGLVMSARKK